MISCYNIPTGMKGFDKEYALVCEPSAISLTRHNN